MGTRRALIVASTLGGWSALVWTLWAQPPPSPSKRALVIGNSAYQNLPPVRAFLASADAMQSALAKLGFQVVSKTDLDQKGMKDQVDAFTAGIRSGDLVFVYYAGYGVQFESENYLVPVNYDPKSNVMISGRAYLVRTLLDQLEQRRAGQRVVVLDAAWECPGHQSISDGLANVLPVDRTLISFPTAPGGIVKPPAGNTPSRFAAALIQAMQVAGLRLMDVFNRVTNDVAAAAGSSQRPYFVPMVADNFYFVPPKPEVERVKIITEKEQIQPGESRANQKRDLLNYVWIPPGKFRMGCVPADKQCKEDEKPQHEVEISKGFFITESEIPVSAYQRFMDATAHKAPPPTKTNYGRVATEVPQTQVTWQDAQDYCKWAGGRLPTEAEWEYAARGGKPGLIYPWGDKYDPELANSYANSKRKRQSRLPETTPVRWYPKNGWNLFDMAGNVREWVADAYNAQAYGRPGPFVDPLEQSGSNERVVRGGSYYTRDRDLRSSARDRWDGSKYDNTTGFRCVLPELP